LLDVSYRSDEPESVLIYADGRDARVLRRLIEVLGSEERAQNALILIGFLSRLEKKAGMASATRVKMAKDSFRELVGVSYNDFGRIVESL
jgi:hypothetical protein